MVLNKQRQYLILCEDKQQQYFIRHFLMECNINRSKISCEPLPKSGSGEQYVRENYVKVLKKCINKCKNFTKMGLINLLKKIYKKKDLIYFYLKSLSFKADASSRFI